MVRSVKALLGLVLLLGLAGCSPKQDPFAAIALIGDRPTVLVAECARDEVTSIRIAERPATPATAFPDGRPRWMVVALIAREGPSAPARRGVPAPARIAPFEVPPGWHVTPGEDTLREFREEGEYTLSAGTGMVTFTLAGLRAMAPGHVLAPADYTEQHVVSEARFDELARDFCRD